MPEHHGTEDISGIGNEDPEVNGHIIEDSFGDDVPDSIPLRDKTFTPELRELVARVTSHDPGGKAAVKAPNEMTAEELLQEFHHLFYRTIQLEGLAEADRSCNPFEAFPDLAGDRLASYIHEKMEKLSFNEYALMSYRMDVRCFTATTNSIRDLDSLNFFIDVNDGIYRDIVGDVRGGIITPGMIEDDPFLRKRFPSQKVSGRSSYYINVLKNIARGTMHETLGGGAADAWECCFTPVVVVRLADDAETADPGRITGLLARDLSLPFMLHIRNESRAVRIEECTNIHRAFRLLEFMFQTFVHEGTGACFIITCGDDFSAERRYVIPYFKARVTALAGGKTMISHIDKNRIVIFAAAPDAGKVESLLSEWNRLYPHVFMHRSVESREKMSFSGFLSDHIFQ